MNSIRPHGERHIHTVVDDEQGPGGRSQGTHIARQFDILPERHLLFTQLDQPDPARESGPDDGGRSPSRRQSLRGHKIQPRLPEPLQSSLVFRIHQSSLNFHHLPVHLVPILKDGLKPLPLQHRTKGLDIAIIVHFKLAIRRF